MKQLEVQSGGVSAVIYFQANTKKILSQDPTFMSEPKLPYQHHFPCCLILCSLQPHKIHPRRQIAGIQDHGVDAGILIALEKCGYHLSMRIVNLYRNTARIGQFISDCGL